MEIQTATPVPPAADRVTTEYGAEVRFGVVMYGGVSLAIYINGVANELFEMACATPRVGVVLNPKQASRSREVYRRLACLIGNDALRQQYAARIEAAALAAASGAAAAADPWEGADAAPYSRTRLVVDVIAGTSAGGINGMFLAKALANGEQFSPLHDLWINEGDIGLLLNDKQSYRGLTSPLADRNGAPTSLLNSDRMYAKLGVAMEAMQPLDVTRRPAGQAGSPLVEEIDLFVTTTDIEGSPVPLRLFDKVVYERRFKQSYRFSYPNGVTSTAAANGNDFDKDNNAFLAFAARCTSSFPFAFEPMTLAAVARLKADGAAPGILRWKQFFPNLPRAEVEQGLHQHRAFGDGGYLDNKPFTYVVETLSQRFGNVPLERKLIYIEPSPEQLDPHRMPEAGKTPDALSNSLAALSSIPRYESIREDLQAVLQRNRRIERVERMVRLGELDIGRSDPLARLPGGMPDWATLSLDQTVDIYGVAYLPYLRLRVYAVTDTLADRLGQRWGVDRDSDRQYALRALVRVWREQRFDDDDKAGLPTVTAFLDQFDLDYRLRRLGFVLRRLDQLTRLMHKRLAAPLDLLPAGADGPAALSEVELQLVKGVPERFAALADPAVDAPLGELHRGIRVLGLLKRALTAVRTDMLQARRRGDMRAATDAAGPSRPLALRTDLATALELVLGQAPADASIAGQDNTAMTVVLEPGKRKLASISRTLQESVLYRAQALMAAAAGAGRPSLLQLALEADLQDMRVKRDPARPASAAPAAPETVREPELERINARAGALLGMPVFGTDASAGTPVMRIMVEDVAAEGIGESAGIDGAELAELNSETGRALREHMGGQYRRFDLFDQMSFPLYYDTGTGEPATVEVVRVSPADATSLIDEARDPLHRHKLAGTALGNFGAFLDRRWRLNDIMWGRLDGAERLIDALLPMSDPATVAVRRELIRQAHLGILREALVPDGEEALADLVVTALAGLQKNGSIGQRLQALLTEAGVGDATQRDLLTGMLAALLGDSKLMEYVRHKRVVDPEPDPKTALDSVARATTITGRVLHNIGERRGTGTAAARWLARLGLLLQGVVAVSLPGTLRQRWWTHGMKVLYSFELVALLMALLVGSGDMRTLALTALGLTLGLHLLTLISGDFVLRRRTWLRVVLLSMGLLGIGLALLGAATLLWPAGQHRWCPLNIAACGVAHATS